MKNLLVIGSLKFPYLVKIGDVAMESPRAATTPGLHQRSPKLPVPSNAYFVTPKTTQLRSNHILMDIDETDKENIAPLKQQTLPESFSRTARRSLFVADKVKIK